jgi:hypothetical protein
MAHGEEYYENLGPSYLTITPNVGESRLMPGTSDQGPVEFQQLSEK